MNLNVFKKILDMIINNYNINKFIEVKNKIYARDLFGENQSLLNKVVRARKSRCLFS